MVLSVEGNFKIIAGGRIIRRFGTDAAILFVLLHFLLLLEPIAAILFI